jgi:hypothetical protein
LIFDEGPDWRRRSLGLEAREGASLGERCAAHLAHYWKLSAKRFLRRKLCRMEIASSKRPVIRNPVVLLAQLLDSHGDAFMDAGLMHKYCDDTLLELAGEPPARYDGVPRGVAPHGMAAPTNLAMVSRGRVVRHDRDEHKSDGEYIAIDALGSPLTEDAVALRTHALLVDMMNDPSLRYCTWGELLPDDFDASTYRNAHEDLRALSDNQAMWHYVAFGMSERRRYR